MKKNNRKSAHEKKYFHIKHQHINIFLHVFMVIALIASFISLMDTINSNMIPFPLTFLLFPYILACYGIACSFLNYMEED